MTTFQPGDVVAVHGHGEYEVAPSAFVTALSDETPIEWDGEVRTIPTAWLTLVRRAAPPEPTQPGTVVWAKGAEWPAAYRAHGPGHPYPWRELAEPGVQLAWEKLVVRFRGPLTTTPPGYIPLAALSDDRAEELARVYTEAYGDDLVTTSDAMRAVLAHLRDTGGAR